MKRRLQVLAFAASLAFAFGPALAAEGGCSNHEKAAGAAAPADVQEPKAQDAKADGCRCGKDCKCEHCAGCKCGGGASKECKCGPDCKCGHCQGCKCGKKEGCKGCSDPKCGHKD